MSPICQDAFCSHKFCKVLRLGKVWLYILEIYSVSELCSALFQRCWMAKSSVLVLPNREVLLLFVIYSYSCTACLCLSAIMCLSFIIISFPAFSCVLFRSISDVSPEEKDVLISKYTMFLCQHRKKRFRNKYN